MMKRYALVSLRNTTAEQIARCLPSNYSIGGYLPHDPEADYSDPRRLGPAVLVEGRDDSGWTLHGYVIPRLQSGLHQAVEIDLSHPAMKLLL